MRLPATAGWLLVAAVSAAASGRDEATSLDASSDVARKSADLLGVVSELRSRDVGHLAEEPRARRAEQLDRLEAYARRGEFTLNDRFEWPMPFFVDTSGTRCAVAHLMDESGAGDLVDRLAREVNHAHVSELTGDGALLAWCAWAGFTLTEIAYIQGPGLQMPEVPAIPTIGVGRPADGITGLLQNDQLRDRRIARSTTISDTWRRWWSLHRHEVVPVRPRYHAAVQLTRDDFLHHDRTPRLAKDADIASVLPVLRAALGERSDVASTAAVALARAVRGRPAHQDGVREALLETLVRLRGTDRDFVCLALGLLGDGVSAQHLASLIGDTKDGRKLLRRSNPVPERTRTFAALGYAFSEHATSAPLLAVLDDPGRSRADLRSAALLGLGLLLERNPQDRSIVTPLVDAWRTAHWPTPVQAHLPLALSRAADPAIPLLLLDPVTTFRDPAEIRRACVKALGDSLPADAMSGFAALEAIVRRDTDATTRQTAIMALAAWASRIDLVAEPEGLATVRQVVRLLDPALDGAYRHGDDLPWHALAAGLVAEAHPGETAMLRAKLASMQQSGHREARAAAGLALGLARAEDAIPALVERVTDSSDAYLTGWAAESLGLLDARREGRAPLLSLLEDHASERVRFQAAVGLGLMADTSLVEPLVAELRSTRSHVVQAGLTRGIGELGDRLAIPALLEIAQDRRTSTPMRSRALGALGMILEESSTPWPVPLQSLASWSLATPNVRDVLSLF